MKLELLYTTCACGHNHVIELAGYRDVLNSFLNDVHSGKLTADTIQPDYYKNLTAKLTGAVAEGLGGASFGGTDFKNTLKAHLDHNIYAFSGAKSLVMLQEYNKLLQDENGDVRSFKDFKAAALQVDKLYNKTYLEAEYNNAIASAQMAEKWQGLKGFKMLEFRTVGDNRVRPLHAQLDKLIIASNSPLLNKFYPPLAWGCRCTMVPAPDDAVQTENASDLVKSAGIPKYFQKNVGKDRTIFRDGHPYIKKIGAGRIREFDAVKDYGMKTVDRIYATADLPPLDYLESRVSAQKWLSDQGQSFDLATADGLSVRFNKDFAKTVMATSETNYQIVNKVPDVLKRPDEIWSKIVDGKLRLTYIKYYDIAPVIVEVGDGGEVLEATSASRASTGVLNRLRKGQLKFKQ